MLLYLFGQHTPFIFSFALVQGRTRFTVLSRHTSLQDPFTAATQRSSGVHIASSVPDFFHIFSFQARQPSQPPTLTIFYQSSPYPPIQHPPYPIHIPLPPYLIHIPLPPYTSHTPLTHPTHTSRSKSPPSYTYSL